MNLFSNTFKLTGMAAPPLQPPQINLAPPVAAVASPTSPAPAGTVQQSVHVGTATTVTARKLAPELAADPRREGWHAARFAWIDGKPRNAPAVWPMFPGSERAGSEAKGSDVKDDPLRPTWGRAAILGAAAGGSDAGRAGSIQGGGLLEAVKVIRGPEPAPISGGLGVA